MFCIETKGISGISIRTDQLFLCGYNPAGSSLIAPPLRHSSHTIIRRWKILECQSLCCFSPYAQNHSQTIYHLSAASVRPINLKLNQPSSAQASKFSCVCVCLGGRAVGSTQIPCRGLWKRDPAKRPSVNTFADRFASAWLAFSAFPSALYDGHITLTSHLTVTILKRYFPGSHRLLHGLTEL